MSGTALGMRRLAPAAAMVAAMSISGCAVTSLPDYSTARDETYAALQRIVDEFPAGTRVDVLPDGSPFPCGGGKDGVIVTARRGGYPADGFDAQGWVDALPGRLGEDFRVVDLGVKTSYPAVSFRATAYGDGLVSVDVDDRGEGPIVIGVIMTSRCAQPPEEGTP